MLPSWCAGGQAGAGPSRRCGELLKQIEPANGKRTNLEPDEGTLIGIAQVVVALH